MSARAALQASAPPSTWRIASACSKTPAELALRESRIGAPAAIGRLFFRALDRLREAPFQL